MNWKMMAMIFRLATSVLEKHRESISVVPNWDSLQNLRAKIRGKESASCREISLGPQGEKKSAVKKKKDRRKPYVWKQTQV